MKLSEVKDYSEFMKVVYVYSRENWDSSVCLHCGGLGIVPIVCCSGTVCSCQGLPVDFVFKCSECGREGPEEI